MSSTKKTYQNLISKGIAAIHYQHDLSRNIDRTVLKNHSDPQNYKKNSAGRKVIERLVHYCKAGAIVVADYSEPNYTSPRTDIQKTVKIGILPGNTSLKVARYETDPEDREDYPYGLFYKQVRLSNVVELRSSDLALILAIHPRGNTAIHWEEGEKAMKFIYKRELDLKLDTKSIGFEVLFPAQQEVLCSEYLRSKAPPRIRVKYLLLPVGRGMKSIDIFGSNDEATILAQVSFTVAEDKLKEKIAALEEVANKGQNRKDIAKVYFGPKEIRETVKKCSSEVFFVSLEEVFESMKDTGILDDMLGVRLN